MKFIILFLIRIYQKFLSREGICRFTPSCSQYTYEAIERYGILKGAKLGISRVLKCHPYSIGGLDPLSKKIL